MTFIMPYTKLTSISLRNLSFLDGSDSNPITKRPYRISGVTDQMASTVPGLRPESKLNRNVLFESPWVKKVVQECSLHPSVFVHAALNHALDKLEKVLTRAPALFSVNLRTGDRRKIKVLTFEGYETLIVAIWAWEASLMGPKWP